MVMNKGGTVVEKGLYWSPLDGRQVSLREDGILPGDERERYWKISPIGLLLIAPFFGMMYVLFLPLFGVSVFIISGLVSAVSALAAIALQGVKVCGRPDNRNALFNSRPLRAVFHGLRKKVKTDAQDRAGVSHGRKGDG
jgi:hypothetical protein